MNFVWLLGTGLRAIKPLRRQKYSEAKLLPTLEVFKSNSGPSHFDHYFCMVIGTGLRAIKPFGSFQTLQRTIYLSH
ncbi:MAG: hypothetical protein DRR08_27630 [Candidatus Parabeggiatoa sp. nov. 2]|nr:MAG: hypothetical protein B6247_12165 [Beggiatoa sp. 4572_84]RKZ53134.1 MAG: hypothetical protein DRR08_27630 [Gammaproteobacteria bacterium]